MLADFKRNKRTIKSTKESNKQTHLLATPPKPLDHLAIESQRERLLRPGVRACGRVSRSVWPHDVGVGTVQQRMNFFAPDQSKRRTGATAIWAYLFF